MENIGSFINWIVYSGGAVLIASFVLDRIPGFLNLSSEYKKVINIVVSAVLALGFYAVLVYVPADILKTLDPWFKVIAGFIAVYSGQQVVHNLTKPE